MEYNKLALEYSLKANQHIKDIIESLFNNYSFNHFGYLRIFNDGHYLGLHSDDEFTKYFVENIHNQGEVFQNEIRKTLPNKFHFFLWHPQPQDYITSVIQAYKICHGLSCYYRNEDSIEIWSFATPPENDQVYNIYLNNLEYFKNFSMHFNMKAKSLIDCSDRKKLALFRDGVNIAPYEHSLIKKNNSLENFHTNKFLNNGKRMITLSSREAECLSLLAKGKTMKEIARIISLSPRTIEQYLNNMKHKIGCSNKSQLLNIYYNNL